MAMKARYTVVDGEVIAEKRGGVRHQFVPDPLGSTIALLDNTQTQTDTFTYWPYGEEQSRTGTTATPLRFVGTLGYYRDSSTRSYVRARYLSTQQGRWLTQDPIGFDGGDFNLYRYTANQPIDITDATGLGPNPKAGTPIPCPREVRKLRDDLCRGLNQINLGGAIDSSKCCVSPQQSQCLIDWCTGGGRVYCIKDDTGDCGKLGSCAIDYPPGGGKRDTHGHIYLCYPRVVGPRCAWTKKPGATCKSELIDRILHEMFHLCGEPQGGSIIPPGQISPDPAENRAQCLCGKMGL